MTKQEFLERYAAGQRDFKGICMMTENLSGYDLSDCDFTNGDFWCAMLIGTKLTNCIFANSDLVSADFTDADISGADFSNAQMRWTLLKNAKVGDKDANFETADLEHSDFAKI